MPYVLAGKRVWVAGHRGMVGSALVRRLAREDCTILMAGRDEADLTDRPATLAWLSANRPHAVFVAAAKVGGIEANRAYPADFLSVNLAIQSHVIEGSFDIGVEKLVFLGSSCIYPKHARQPIPESALLTGPLEPTNEAYAIAKIAGIKLCQAFRRQHGRDFVSAMPTNLYGPGDNYDLETSHVIPALLRKAHEAKSRGKSEMSVWGTGAPLREFLHADDCADALVRVMTHYSEDEHINVGSGAEISIAAVARLVAETVGYGGTIVFDPSRPDGTPRKLMDGAKLRALGWRPRIGLRDGLAAAYAAFLKEGGVQARQ